MSVSVSCPHCSLARSVPEDKLGALAKCPGCQNVFRLERPAPAAPAGSGRPAIRAIRCPACAKRFGVAPETPDGSEVACPHCAAVSELTPEGARLPAVAAMDPFAAEPAAPAFDPGATAVDGDDPGDFVAFLNAQRTTRPAPGPPPLPASASRYGSQVSGPTADADCVLRPFDCPEDASIGQMITAKVQEMLAKEGLFDEVLISESPSAWGRKVTVEDHDTTALVNPGSFFTYGRVHLRVVGAVHPARGDAEPFAVEAIQPGQKGMSAKAMLKAAVKTVSIKVGREVVQRVGGYKHLRVEINSYATAACVFGVLGLIPIVGLLLFALGLIPTILVFVYNRGRPEKVGMRRTWTGLVVGGLSAALWGVLLIMASNNQLR